MASSILDHFWESILIIDINGKSNTVTFRYTTDSIKNQFYRQRHSGDSNVDKPKIVQTAVNLLPSNIKCVEQQQDVYPDACQMSFLNECLGYLPETLHILLHYLFVGNNTGKTRISISWPSNDTGNKAKGIIVPLQMHHLEFDLMYFLSKYIGNRILWNMNQFVSTSVC